MKFKVVVALFFALLALAPLSEAQMGQIPVDMFKVGAAWNGHPLGLAPDGTINVQTFPIMLPPHPRNFPELAQSNGCPFGFSYQPGQQIGMPGFGELAKCGWNSLHWPENAKAAYALTDEGRGVNGFVQNNFYVAPPGAPCYPQYAHRCPGYQQPTFPGWGTWTPPKPWWQQK